jgi:D-amino peptidase
MQNLRPERLHRRASLLSGKHKPLYMMEGLDASFGAAFLVSYHGSISARTAVLSHTYNPSVVYHAELNGHVVGESGINALVARHYEVPIALVTGDEATAEEIRPFSPEAECVVVKRSITRFAAESVHPEAACELIREGAARALDRIAQMGPPAIRLPATLDVQLTTSDYAELGTWLHGVERTGPRSLRIADDEPLRLFKTWVTLIALTRCIREQE